MGVKSLSLLNQALLGKWCWKYISDRKVSWKQIIEVKYGKEGVDWHPREVRDGYGVGVWKTIKKGWDLFFNGTTFEVGNGRRLKF